MTKKWLLQAPNRLKYQCPTHLQNSTNLNRLVDPSSRVVNILICGHCSSLSQRNNNHYMYGGSLSCIFTLSILEHRQQNIFSRPLWVRRWLLFQQNSGKQYSYTTNSRRVHHRQSIATYRPILGRHISRLSVDISAESVDRYSVD